MRYKIFMPDLDVWLCFLLNADFEPWVMLLQGKEGFVKHMYRGALFIHDVSQSENLGLFVTRADLVVKTSSKATCHKGTVCLIYSFV